MNYKVLVYLTCLLAGSLFFSSCEKQNIDKYVVEEEDVAVAIETECDTFRIDVFIEGDEALVVDVKNGKEPYNILWSTGETETSVGLYGREVFSVTVEDANGCSAELIVNANCPGFEASIVEGTPEGVLNLDVQNGTAPFTYLWSTGEATASIIVPESKFYTATVVDASGCLAYAAKSFQFEEDHPCFNTDLVVEITQSATGNLLTAEVTGGTYPYNYNWPSENPYWTGHGSLRISESGTYNVNVEDANGCTTTASIVAEVMPSPCELFEAEIVHVGDGVLEVEISGGTAPYRYEWSTGETSESIMVTESGEYWLYIEDAEGCGDELFIEIEL